MITSLGDSGDREEGRSYPSPDWEMRPGGGDVGVQYWKGGFLSRSMFVPHLGALPSFLGAVARCTFTYFLEAVVVSYTQ